MNKTRELKEELIEAGEAAVYELIKVAKEVIIGFGEMDTDLGADKLKNAAAAKKMAIFDAFEILARIEQERENLGLETSSNGKSTTTNQGFAESRSK